MKDILLLIAYALCKESLVLKSKGCKTSKEWVQAREENPKHVLLLETSNKADSWLDQISCSIYGEIVKK